MTKKEKIQSEYDGVMIVMQYLLDQGNEISPSLYAKRDKLIDQAIKLGFVPKTKY